MTWRWCVFGRRHPEDAPRLITRYRWRWTAHLRAWLFELWHRAGSSAWVEDGIRIAITGLGLDDE